tara:strand:+ start:1199 stop:1330 length:132 start_codon:yes stop_codon:yes gene_type:complete
MKTNDVGPKVCWFLFKEARKGKVNLEGWWHPRRYIRNAEGEEK